MKSLARYAATNALTRTMLSEILTRDDFEIITRSESVEGAWLALRRTDYGKWIPPDPPEDILGVEKILRETTASRFRRSIHVLRGRPREVGELLLSRWDLDDLEFALRLWHGKDKELERFLTYPSYVDEIPVYDIVEAQNLEGIGLLLRNTPYIEPVTASLRTYHERNSIFYVEMSLERDFYRRLVEAVSDLGGADADRALKIVGAEIDFLNLSWLTRLMEYHGIEPSAFSRYMVRGPSEISRRLAEPGLTVERLGSIRTELMGPGIDREGEVLTRLDSCALLEGMVGEMAVDLARSTLAGYPFSIGCVFAFYLLKRNELRNLHTVFTGKSVGAAEPEIMSRLHGLR
jgi:V/A-type H+-transporting ATPase subunit C